MVSSVVAFASAIGVYVSIHSSSRWETRQIPLLERIIQNTRGTEITARTFPVLRVVDGDTFKIEYDGEPTSVRFHGINPPERSDPNGPAATEALRKMIGGKVVRIEFPGKRKRDNFGQLLCKVYVGRMDVGAEMLRRGHAKVYVGRER